MATEVAVSLIAALAALGVALINSRASRGMRREVKEVHASTVNSHGPDLRHDVDIVKADLAEVLDMVRRVPRLETRVADHLAESTTYRRTVDRNLRDIVAAQGEQAQAIGHLAEALPIVARSTPDPTDTKEA